jgi:hypothetical protein
MHLQNLIDSSAFAHANPAAIKKIFYVTFAKPFDPADAMVG